MGKQELEIKTVRGMFEAQVFPFSNCRLTAGLPGDFHEHFMYNSTQCAEMKPPIEAVLHKLFTAHNILFIKLVLVHFLSPELSLKGLDERTAFILPLSSKVTAPSDSRELLSWNYLFFISLPHLFLLCYPCLLSALIYTYLAYFITFQMVL